MGKLSLQGNTCQNLSGPRRYLTRQMVKCQAEDVFHGVSRNRTALPNYRKNRKNRTAITETDTKTAFTETAKLRCGSSPPLPICSSHTVHTVNTAINCSDSQRHAAPTSPPVTSPSPTSARVLRSPLIVEESASHTATHSEHSDTQSPPCSAIASLLRRPLPAPTSPPCSAPLSRRTTTGGNLHQSVNQNLHLSPTYVKPCDNHTLMDVDHDELDVSPVNIIRNSEQVKDISTPLRSSQPASDDGLEVIDICSSPLASEEAAAVPCSSSNMCYTMQFSFEELKKRRHQKLSAFQARKKKSQVVKEDAKAQALSAATSEFEKLFKKQDFGRMKVVAFQRGTPLAYTDESRDRGFGQTRNIHGKIPHMRSQENPDCYWDRTPDLPSVGI
ncbi:hypothetical protein LXL04_018902 [Taraxacum kok-saghyz]